MQPDEDKWFRIATAVYAQVKRLFAEVVERPFGLRLEIVEAPLMKIEVAVDREGKVAAVRCRAALDLGVETVFIGIAPGYRLEKTTTSAEKAAGWGVFWRGWGGSSPACRCTSALRRTT